MIKAILEKAGWKLERIDPSLAAAPPVRKLHLEGRGRFDHGNPGIKHGPWGSTYYEKDMLRVAVGKDGWAPLYVTLAMLSEEGRELMRREFADLFGYRLPREEECLPVTEGGPSTIGASWIEANRYVFSVLDSEDRERSREGYDSISGYVIGVRFSHLRKAARPMELRGFIGVSEEHAKLHEEPAIKAMREASKEAITYFEGVAVSWLRARGLQVDVERYLVRVDRYEPLYGIHESVIED